MSALEVILNKGNYPSIRCSREPVPKEKGEWPQRYSWRDNDCQETISRWTKALIHNDVNQGFCCGRLNLFLSLLKVFFRKRLPETYTHLVRHAWHFAFLFNQIVVRTHGFMLLIPHTFDACLRFVEYRSIVDG